MHFIRTLAVAIAALAVPSAALGQEIGVGPGDLYILPQGEQGCWVSFFAGERFEGPAVQFTGRTLIESFDPYAQAIAEPPLQKVGGVQFMQEVGSVVVGPFARLVGYGEDWFRGGETIELGPGLHVRDLDAIDFHERVRSFKVFCVDKNEVLRR